MSGYTVEVRQSEPGRSFRYVWTLRYDGRQVARSWADTRWGARRAARKAVRKHDQKQRSWTYEVTP